MCMFFLTCSPAHPPTGTIVARIRTLMQTVAAPAHGCFGFGDVVPFWGRPGPCGSPVVMRGIINMKRLLVGLLTLSTILSAGAEELEWLTDVPAALAKAKAENKIVFMDFTGSDWCGWCMKLKSDVFSQPQFTAFAKANFVMV